MIKLSREQTLNNKLANLAMATGYWSARNENEIRIKDFLESSGYTWEVQFPYTNRIFDFYCHELCLAIEVDGKKDYLHEMAKDDLAFKTNGVVVIRIGNKTNEYVLNFIKSRLFKFKNWETRPIFAKHYSEQENKVMCLEFLRSCGFTRSVENMYGVLKRASKSRVILEQSTYQGKAVEQKDREFMEKNPNAVLPNMVVNTHVIITEDLNKIEEHIDRVMEKAAKSGWGEKAIRRRIEKFCKTTKTKKKRKALRDTLYGLDYRNC